MAKWKFREVVADQWVNEEPSVGAGDVSFSTDSDGFKHFFVDYTPVSVDENNTSNVQKIKTSTGEDIRIEIFRPNDTKRTTTYSVKLEFQSELVYKKLKYLFNNGKKFNLYSADNTQTSNFKVLYLSMDDLSVNWVAKRGVDQIYHLTLSCTDLSTDSTSNPIKLRFQQITGRKAWSFIPQTLNSSENLQNVSPIPSPLKFTSNHGASSIDESYKKRFTDVETINGKTVRILPVMINSINKVVPIEPLRSITLKLEYQTLDVFTNIKSLYRNAEEFAVYDNDAVNGSFIMNATIEDLTMNYQANKGKNRLYAFSITLRELDN